MIVPSNGEQVQHRNGWTKVPNSVLGSPDLTNNEKIVYSILKSLSFQGKLVTITQERLGEHAQLKRTALNGCLGRLHREFGLITIHSNGRPILPHTRSMRI